MNNTIRMNDHNKIACLDVLGKQVDQGISSIGDDNPKKRIYLFDRIMEWLMMQDSAPVDGKGTPPSHR
jgi:hypothetical protein